MTVLPSTCKLIRPGETYVGQQGFSYIAGLTGANAGARGLCMTVLPLPDGARARTHLHRGIETAAYILEGVVDMYYGERLEHFLQAQPGEFVYVPADMPHLVLNRSGAPAKAVVAHSAADDQDGIVLLPELDGLV
jgi:uncharacterized RmlC-like cupin family protein